MVLSASSQFTKAELQATGLTCAMCSNAINKAVSALPYVESVTSDIKNSSFNIAFKDDAKTSIDGLRQAVEEAGFSVGSLKVTGNLTGVQVKNEAPVKIGDQVFAFLKTKDQVLTGETTLQVVDKGFVTEKEFKKLRSAIKRESLQTGKADQQAVKQGVPEGTRIYHVTI